MRKTGKRQSKIKEKLTKTNVTTEKNIKDEL